MQLDLIAHLPAAAPRNATPAEAEAAAFLETSGRRSTQCAAILYRLRQGRASNAELAECYGLRYGARIYDLRHLGYSISTLRAEDASGLVFYELDDAGADTPKEESEMDYDRCCSECHAAFDGHGQCCLRAREPKRLALVVHRPGRKAARPLCVNCEDAPAGAGGLCAPCQKAENERWADLARRIG